MTAADILEEACESGIASLSEEQLWIVIAQALADSAGMTAEELLEAACESGISSLRGDSLLIAIAEGINQSS